MIIDANDQTRSIAVYSAPGVLAPITPAVVALLGGGTKNPRPYTAAENAAADAAIGAQAAAAAREATRATVRAIIADLQAEKARAQTVIDKTNSSITGGDTKDVARAAKRIADAAIDLARFVRDMP